jgi:hypothetical protein
VLHEITTRDIGERKESFGYTARHVITTHKVTPLEGTEVPQETITDGWYIDLDTQLSCDPPDNTPSEGTTYSTVRLVAKSGDNVSASSTSFVQMTYVGKPENGFPIWVKRTTHRGEQVTTSENEVTELSTKPIDPTLFEVPKNFRSVERNLPWPRAAFWARWLAWGHHHWVRFRQADSVRSCFWLAVVLLSLAPGVVAYDHPLGSHAIRESYFMGSGRYAEFLSTYTKNLSAPKTGPDVAQVEVRTPFAQVIVSAHEHSVGYSAQSAAQDYRKNPDTVQVRVEILSTATYAIGSQGTVPEILAPPACQGVQRMNSVGECFRDFKFSFSQEKEIKPKSSYAVPMYRGEPSILIGADIWFTFSTADIASEPFQVTVSTPDRQMVSAEFDLATLR